MAYRAVYIDQDPVDYFVKQDENGFSRLNLADVVLRANQDPKEIFARMIRFATNSNWSHCALVLLLSNFKRGYDSTFLIESMTRGVRVADWRKAIVPYQQYTVGIKRLPLDWYAESPYEKSRRTASDPEDTYGVDYLSCVRGMALDQINSLYDHKAIFEMAALYVKRIARRHLRSLPWIAGMAGAVADLFRRWSTPPGRLEEFICGGLIQYSFFEAMRKRILNDLNYEEDRETALHNLQHIQRIIFAEDPDRIIASYIRQVQIGKRDLADPVPERVLDLLKTATPADFNNSPNLEWKYIILDGKVWKIEEADNDYEPESTEEAKVLELLKPDHRDGIQLSSRIRSLQHNK